MSVFQVQCVDARNTSAQTLQQTPHVATGWISAANEMEHSQWLEQD
ncbi:hypothetical protein B9479_000508 [Cryptococcus floricola]|uniref:Uncharacterized protein n=1 Tax=Cryptococcus floricola TaxID=2591691 RepID=A0A5D3B6V8_9TREE|nr:hypothetical protein B9479_000508 [Cryptococcus floricola]